MLNIISDTSNTEFSRSDLFASQLSLVVFSSTIRGVAILAITLKLLSTLFLLAYTKASLEKIRQTHDAGWDILIV